jgi:zinc protease
MSFLSKLRPSLLILFSLFLSGVLWLGNFSVAALQTDVAPVSGLSLTQGVRKTVLNNGLTVLTKEVHTLW